MRVLLYKTKHGGTRKIAKVIDAYIGDCILMDFDAIDLSVLKKADVIAIGVPVYYGKLPQDVVKFIKNNQDFLIARDYSLFVTGLLYSEFMSYVTDAFDFHLLKNVKVISGLGGALYYPELSISEKMALNVMNQRSPVIPKEHNKKMYQNFNNNEIEIFANKIRRLDEKATSLD